MSNHAMSVFKNSCRSAPVKSPSKRPKTASASESPKVASDIRPKTASASASLKVPSDSTPKTTSSSTQHYGNFDSPKKIVLPISRYSEDEYSTLFNTLLESNSLLHKEIGKLRKEHQLSMSKLANQDHNKNRCSQCKRVPSQDSWVSGTEIDLEEFRKTKSVTVHIPENSTSSKDMEVESVSGSESGSECEQSVGFDTPEEFPTDSDSHSYRITYISTDSSSENSPNTSQYASPGQLVVGNMWDNFSVENFSVENFSEAFYIEEKDMDKSRTPKVTVPEPFSMTLREASAIKKKTKSMLIAEKEQEERDASARVMKKFHASPIPAHTFLPLYDLMNAENKQRRVRMKKCTREILKSNQKPFKFSKRDEEKREEKSKLLRQIEEQERRQIRENKFKAKPVPSNLFDPEIEAEALEKEEYRRIRIRMRAEQLIVQARAPYTMRLEEEKAKGPRLPHKKKVVKSHHTVYTFCPKVTHKIPDYTKAYSKFQQQLIKKKQSKLTTVSEPFFLRTEKRAKVIRKPEETMGTRLGTVRSETTCRSTRAANPPSTETTRRRQSLTNERIAEAIQKDALEERKASARRSREKEVQKIVAKRSSELNMYTGLLEEKRMVNLQKMK